MLVFCAYLRAVMFLRSKIRNKDGKQHRVFHSTQGASEDLLDAEVRP